MSITKEQKISKLKVHQLLVIEQEGEVSEKLAGDYFLQSATDENSAVDKFDEKRTEAVLISPSFQESAVLLMCASLKKNPLFRGVPVIILLKKPNELWEILGLRAGADDVLAVNKSTSVLKLKIDQIIHYRYFKRGDSQFLKRVNRAIDSRINDPDLKISDLAQSLKIDRKTLYRNIKMESGLTAQIYLKNYRLELGAKLIENGELSITQVANSTGFHSVSYFSRCFKDHFGITPSEWDAT